MVGWLAGGWPVVGGWWAMVERSLSRWRGGWEEDEQDEHSQQTPSRRRLDKRGRGRKDVEDRRKEEEEQEG